MATSTTTVTRISRNTSTIWRRRRRRIKYQGFLLAGREVDRGRVVVVGKNAREITDQILFRLLAGFRNFDSDTGVLLQYSDHAGHVFRCEFVHVAVFPMKNDGLRL